MIRFMVPPPCLPTLCHTNIRACEVGPGRPRIAPHGPIWCPRGSPDSFVVRTSLSLDRAGAEPPTLLPWFAGHLAHQACHSGKMRYMLRCAVHEPKNPKIIFREAIRRGDYLIAGILPFNDICQQRTQSSLNGAIHDHVNICLGWHFVCPGLGRNPQAPAQLGAQFPGLPNLNAGARVDPGDSRIELFPGRTFIGRSP